MSNIGKKTYRELYMVFTMTGSVALLAIIYAVNGIPSILISLISGVVVGYYSKKKVVWLTNLGRGVIVMLTGVLFIMGRLEVWHLFVLTILNSSLESFNSPASNTLFTEIVKEQNIPVQVAIFKYVDKEYLPRVLSFINVMALSSAPLGGALVGALLGFMPMEILLYIFGAALLLLFLKQITNKALADL